MVFKQTKMKAGRLAFMLSIILIVLFIASFVLVSHELIMNKTQYAYADPVGQNVVIDITNSIGFWEGNSSLVEASDFPGLVDVERTVAQTYSSSLPQTGVVMLVHGFTGTSVNYILYNDGAIYSTAYDNIPRSSFYSYVEGGWHICYIGVPHVHDGVTFEPWLNPSAFPNVAGNYFLATDIKLLNAAGWTAPQGVTNLCLNGHVYTASDWRGEKGFVAIKVEDGSTLNLYDDGVGEHRFYQSENMAIIDDEPTSNNKTFTGGYITGVDSQTGGGSGGVRVVGGTFNMYGGTIIGNGLNGASVDVKNEGSFTMYGGAILANYSRTGVAGINVDPGATAKLYGGRIEYNISKYGAVYFEGSATLTLGSRAGLEPLQIRNNIAIVGDATVPNNLWCEAGATFDLDFAADVEAQIGITISESPADISSAIPAGKDNIKNYFTADLAGSDYRVIVKDGKLHVTNIIETNPSNNTPAQNNASADKESHGFCIGWVVFIFAILEILCACLYAVLRFGLIKEIIAKCKLDVLYGKMDLLTLIGLCVSGAIFLFALIALCVHQCAISIISFILATIICGGFTCFFVQDKGIIKMLKKEPQQSIEDKADDKEVEEPKSE